MHIALVGLPGSGKSTIGRQLARLCGVELVDVDAQIEVHLGCSIKDYFASHGEEAFRDVEAQVLARLLGQEGFGEYGIVILSFSMYAAASAAFTSSFFMLTTNVSGSGNVLRPSVTTVIS